TDISSGQVKAGDNLFSTEGLTVGDTKVTTDGVQVGNIVNLGGSGLVIIDGPSVTNDGIDAGGMKITNVASGDVSKDSTDAVNGSQLWKAMQEAGGSWYLAAGENADSESVEVSKGNTVKFIVGDQPEDSDNLFIAPDDKDKKTVKFTIKENPTFAGQVTATGGFNASGKKIVNVAEGDVNENSTEAINGSQLFSVAKAIGGKVENNKVSFNVTMKADANNTNGVKKNYSNVADALNAADDTLYNMTQHFTTKQLTVEGNSDFRGDVTVGGSFTANGPALFKEEVTMEKGLNMSNSKIRGLADGEADDEAVNMGQLKAMGNRLSSGMGDMYNTLNKDIRQVGSRAAALAGLHAPMYRPERRTGFNAALGFYRGDTTLAMGLTHYFSEDSMISAAATVGHKPMVNVGWSVRLGRGDMVIKTTRRRVDEHEVRNADLEARVQELEKRLGVSPKVDHHPEKITGRVPLDQRVSDLEMSAAPVSAKSDVDAKLDEILKKRAARKRRSGK
ncbi:MAG: hypothetical protein J5974_03960, partial [Pyramidobacter sp.]|nr:hypothetical protein [Pyramidobacter sp.]